MTGKKKKTEVIERIDIEDFADKKIGCIGCVFNDKGYCYKQDKWCSKVFKKNGICSYRVDYTPEEIEAKKEKDVTVISGWLGYVKTNKHKPWDMPL